MTKLKDLLDDVLELAEKHGLDVVDLLYDIASAVSDTAKIATNESVPPPNPTKDAHSIAAEHARLMESMEHCHIAQQFWLKKPKGFQASAPEVYRLAGLPWRHRSKRFSLWLTGRPEARARFAGRRDQPGRHRIWERI